MTLKKPKRGGAGRGQGRKPGEPQIAVKFPVRLVVAAREEKARRLPSRASIPQILTEWVDAGRDLT